MPNLRCLLLQVAGSPANSALPSLSFLRDVLDRLGLGLLGSAAEAPDVGRGLVEVVVGRAPGVHEMHSTLRAASSSAKAGVRIGPPSTANGLMSSAMVTASARAATSSADGAGGV